MGNENSEGQRRETWDFKAQDPKDRDVKARDSKNQKSPNQELRREKMTKRNLLDRETVQRLSREAVRNLLIFEACSEAFRSCETYLCYAPLKQEVCLENYYARLLALGKKLYFPRTEAKQMEFFRVSDLKTDLAPGNFKIREPKGKERYDGIQKAAALVPGVVFDCRGNRIGYGGGYYDRYFSRHENIIKIGVCYEMQLAEDIVPEKWDIPMDAVVTDIGVKFERSRSWN